MSADELKKIIFYRDWYNAVKDFDDNTRLKMYDSIFGYAFTGNINVEPIISIAFNIIKARIDADVQKYEDVRTKRSDAGIKGNLKRWGDKSQESQDVAKVANATTYRKCSQKSQTSQKVANVANNINSNININNNINNNNINNKEESIKEESVTAIAATRRQFYDDLLCLWNETMKDRRIPCIKDITPARQKSVNARMAQYGEEAVINAVSITACSSFLNGDTGKFIASFDWVYSPTNFIKVIEGNYNDASNTRGFTTGNKYDDQALRVIQSVISQQDQ